VITIDLARLLTVLSEVTFFTTVFADHGWCIRAILAYMTFLLAVAAGHLLGIGTLGTTVARYEVLDGVCSLSINHLPSLTTTKTLVITAGLAISVALSTAISSIVCKIVTGKVSKNDVELLCLTRTDTYVAWPSLPQPSSVALPWAEPPCSLPQPLMIDSLGMDGIVKLKEESRAPDDDRQVTKEKYNAASVEYLSTGALKARRIRLMQCEVLRKRSVLLRRGRG